MEVHVQPTVPSAVVRRGFLVVAVQPKSVSDAAAAAHPGDNHSALANVRPLTMSGCRSSEEEGHSRNQDKVSTPSQPHDQRFPHLTGNVKRAGTTMTGRTTERRESALPFARSSALASATARSVAVMALSELNRAAADAASASSRAERLRGPTVGTLICSRVRLRPVRVEGPPERAFPSTYASPRGR